MKKFINKGLVLALIAVMGLASVDCQRKKIDNTGLLLAALFFLNQPEYTVVLTGTLKGADNLPMKDGKVSISDAEGSLFYQVDREQFLILPLVLQMVLHLLVERWMENLRFYLKLHLLTEN